MGVVDVLKGGTGGIDCCPCCGGVCPAGAAGAALGGEGVGAGAPLAEGGGASGQGREEPGGGLGEGGGFILAT